MPGDNDHWNDVAREWTSRGTDRVWREFTDRLQISLLDRWIDGAPSGSGIPVSMALKTDLFDEVAGTGLVHYLRSRGYRCVGVDISTVVVAEASRRIPDLAPIVADVCSLPFEDCVFDLVFSGSTLDHFDCSDDIGVAIREIVRVLRPGGRLVITLDNPVNPIVWLRNGPVLGLRRRCGIVPYQVGATIGPRALAAFIAASGLDVHHVTFILHCPRVLAVWLSRMIEGRPTATRERFLATLSRWEWLERWPTRSLSGHFTAIVATKAVPSGLSAPPSRTGPC
jgi:SAM-dependent methyltransferase